MLRLAKVAALALRTRKRAAKDKASALRSTNSLTVPSPMILPCRESNALRQTRSRRSPRTARIRCRPTALECMAGRANRTRSPCICSENSDRHNILRCTKIGIAVPWHRLRTQKYTNRSGNLCICRAHSVCATRSLHKRAGNQHTPHHPPHLMSKRRHWML